MTDAEVIYDALLRAERRLEVTARDANFPQAAELARSALIAVQTIREEVGSALATHAPL